jgi:DNA-binding CsgD family transcriptional regulator
MMPVGFKASLTGREREVLELVANGHSAKEIGKRLGIAARTVERHTENLRLKMRARNRAHMITRAVLAGVLKVGTAPVTPRLCAECLFQPREEEEGEGEENGKNESRLGRLFGGRPPPFDLAPLSLSLLAVPAIPRDLVFGLAGSAALC